VRKGEGCVVKGKGEMFEMEGPRGEDEVVW